jgi:alkaline phosphatase
MQSLPPPLRSLSNENSNYWHLKGVEEIKKSLFDRREVKSLAKNVILFLGDGMGISTVTAARIYKAQRQKPRIHYGEETFFIFERFPNVGLIKTYNVDRTTPDSAGTATAYLCGVKTNMGIVGVDRNVLRGQCETYDSKYDTPSILMQGLKEGKSVGFVTTTRVTHASPAATYAALPERKWESDVERNQHIHDENLRSRCLDAAVQMITKANGFHVMLGGGAFNFLPNNTISKAKTNTPFIGKRLDGRDLIQEWKDNHEIKNKKAKFIHTRDELLNLDSENVDHVLGLFSESHMSYNEERPNNEPSLAEMTKAAIKLLSKNPRGYILFVEGGRIDHGHHANLAKYALGDTVAFEEAILTANKLTSEHDTLTIVTADHSHEFVMGGYSARGKDVLTEAGGRNSPIGKHGLDNKPFTILRYANGPGAPVNRRRENLTGIDTTQFGYRFQALVPLKSAAHGGEDVSVYAQGPWAHLFFRVHEQTHVANVIRFATCLPPFHETKCLAKR